MERRGPALVVAGLALLGLGLALPFVAWLRGQSDRAVCLNHLREIASFGVWHAALPGSAVPKSAAPELPAGTVVRAGLAPERRASWLVTLLPALEDRQPGALDVRAPFDPTKSWDDPAHAALARTRVTAYLCPSGYTAPPADAPKVTHFVGLAGLGADAPTLSLAREVSPTAGAMRYDEPTPVGLFADGLSNTLLVAETSREIGPWLAGGPPTLRGLDPNDDAPLGPGRALGGRHAGGTSAAFADGSARLLNDRIAPAVLRALVTLAGNDG